MEDCTGLILAGGQSKRMGCDKALLQLKGKCLLQWQVEKFQNLGVKEILISGTGNPTFPGVRAVPDVYPGCGPISGLHAGLSSASCQHCIVICVDMPLVPGDVFIELCKAHDMGVTILRHSDGEEPLIGVYDRATAVYMEKMIQQGVYAVRALEKTVPYQRWDYSGEKDFLCNCNYPEDYKQMKRIHAESMMLECTRIDMI